MEPALSGPPGWRVTTTSEETRLPGVYTCVGSCSVSCWRLVKSGWRVVESHPYYGLGAPDEEVEGDDMDY